MDSNPLLVNALDLDRWAATLESKGLFPELMRRLLAQTPGVTNINIRAREGTAAPGWDGAATSAGSAFLPEGELRFEFGTNQDPKRKASEDYEKRAQEAAGATDEIFLFATPRNWAGAAEWAKERQKEGVFASVEAFDAHRLEGWLQSVPAVHCWISERLEKPTSGAQTLTAWWERLRRNCTIEVPPGFHTAGRHKEADKLLDLLATNDKVPSVQAAWRDDVLAFCHAVLLQKDHAELERMLVVSNPEAWRYLAMQSSALIMIPVFDNPDIGLALGNGHRVIHPVIVVNESRDDGDIVRLPKIDRQGGFNLLTVAGLDYSLADKLSSLARRSMSAFYRRISLDKMRKQPEWAIDRETVSVLAPLILVGTWDADHSGDRSEISRFVDLQANKIDSLLDELLEAYPLDPPFIRSGGQWYLVDAMDAAVLLLPKLSEEHRIRWEEFVMRVLLCEDPLEDLSFGESIIAQFEGERSPVSSALRQGVGRSLVLASVCSEKQTVRAASIARCVDDIVKSLLNAALHDESGRLLSRLAPCLPSLAEASPSVFLTSFEDDLNGDKSVTMFLCNDGGSDQYASSTSIHYLLMAVECLCWSQEFFGRAARLLVKLADLAPTEKEVDWCLERAAKTVVGWARLSAGRWDDKATVVKWALEEWPDVGWRLLETVLLSQEFLSQPYEPLYRDWSVEKMLAPVNEREAHVHEILQSAILLAESRIDHWVRLLSVLEAVTPRERLLVVEALQQTVIRGHWDADALFEIWLCVSSIVRRHQSSPQTSGALDAETLQVLINVMSALEPHDDPRRFAWLFEHEFDVTVDGLSVGDGGFFEHIREARIGAIKTVTEQGVGQLRILVENVKDVRGVGMYLSELGSEFESEVLEWLVDETPGLREAASAYVLHAAEKVGTSWALKVLKSDLLTLEGKKWFVAALPAKKAYWELVGEFESALVEAYWGSVNVIAIDPESRREVVDLLLKRGCVSQAITLFWWMLNYGPEPRPELVVEALVHLIAVSGQVGRQDLRYKVGEVLAWLERVVPAPPELPMLEFQFFDGVSSYAPSNALYEYLGKESDKFAELILCIFCVDSSESPMEVRSAHAQRCFSVLYHWKRLPGLRDDGTIDAVHLEAWVDGARQRLSANGGERNYDDFIGEALASSPDGKDGMWPAEEVRDLIESLRNPKMEAGLRRGRVNRTGVTTRGVFEGGTQEAVVAERYRENAREMNVRWPRTAAILRALAKDSEQEAARQNFEAEQRGDQD